MIVVMSKKSIYKPILLKMHCLQIKRTW